MPHYIVLTRLAGGRMRGSSQEDAARTIGDAIRAGCRTDNDCGRWIESYAIAENSPYDFLDIFELSGDEHAQRLVEMIESTGIASAQVMRAKRGLRAPHGNLLNLPAGTRRKSRDSVEEASEESFPASDSPAW